MGLGTGTEPLLSRSLTVADCTLTTMKTYRTACDIVRIHPGLPNMFLLD